MEANGGHKTVLLGEAVEALITDKEGFYVDGTFGRGGHSRLILRGLSEGGRLLGIDKDAQAVAVGSLDFADDQRFEIVRGSFSELAELLKERNVSVKVSGLLLDLGVSSPQLDQPERGFSFLHDAPLDMRMDQRSKLTAEDWVNSASAEEMAFVFKEYGEERFARRIAGAIVDARAERKIKTTTELAKIVSEANPAWEKGKHPATRVFQAIRIFINDELGELEQVLDQALEALRVGGRLVVISFHSLEDRKVKRFIHHHERGDNLPPGLPVTDDRLNKRLKRIGKAVKASNKEVSENPRSRSAVMRVAEKIA
jgi:16S rRNA (cytosine1402-N4)-methyltransferase